EAVFEHTLNARNESELAFFIQKRGLIDDFHWSLENWNLLQHILICIGAGGDEILAIAADHLHRLTLFERAAQAFLAFSGDKLSSVFESLQQLMTFDQDPV